jgi:hypothetical protein
VPLQRHRRFRSPHDSRTSAAFCGMVRVKPYALFLQFHCEFALGSPSGDVLAVDVYFPIVADRPAAINGEAARC